jgi:hypothetical protein
MQLLLHGSSRIGCPLGIIAQSRNRGTIPHSLPLGGGKFAVLLTGHQQPTCNVGTVRDLTNSIYDTKVVA